MHTKTVNRDILNSSSFCLEKKIINLAHKPGRLVKHTVISLLPHTFTASHAQIQADKLPVCDLQRFDAFSSKIGSTAHCSANTIHSAD